MFLVVVTNMMWQGTSSAGIQAASAKPPSPNHKGVDLSLKVSYEGRNCVKDDGKVAFVIQVGSVGGSSKILSSPVKVTFQEPSHLYDVSTSGPDWIFHKDGSLYTGTYRGGYPIEDGEQLGLITVNGYSKGDGKSSDLTASVITSDEVDDLSNNTDSGKIVFCNHDGKDGKDNNGKDGKDNNGKDGKGHNGKDGKGHNGKDGKGHNGKDGKGHNGNNNNANHNNGNNHIIIINRRFFWWRGCPGGGCCGGRGGVGGPGPGPGRAAACPPGMPGTGSDPNA
jgi:hypothetical protein